MAIVTSDKDRRWGISIFTSWKELFAMSERVSNFSIVATRLGSSAEPNQQVYRQQSAPLSSLVGIPCCRTTITPLVVRL